MALGAILLWAVTLLPGPAAGLEASWAGMAVTPLEGPLEPKVGIDAPGGVGIVGVEPGGPADEAGLRFGDVLYGADGEAIDDPEAWIEHLVQLEPGTILVLDVYRLGERRIVELTLAPLPDATPGRP